MRYLARVGEFVRSLDRDAQGMQILRGVEGDTFSYCSSLHCLLVGGPEEVNLYIEAFMTVNQSILSVLCEA